MQGQPFLKNGNFHQVTYGPFIGGLEYLHGTSAFDTVKRLNQLEAVWQMLQKHPQMCPVCSGAGQHGDSHTEHCKPCKGYGVWVIIMHGVVMLHRNNGFSKKVQAGDLTPFMYDGKPMLGRIESFYDTGAGVNLKEHSGPLAINRISCTLEVVEGINAGWKINRTLFSVLELQKDARMPRTATEAKCMHWLTSEHLLQKCTDCNGTGGKVKAPCRICTGYGTKALYSDGKVYFNKGVYRPGDVLPVNTHHLSIHHAKVERFHTSLLKDLVEGWVDVCRISFTFINHSTGKRYQHQLGHSLDREAKEAGVYDMKGHRAELELAREVEA